MLMQTVLLAEDDAGGHVFQEQEADRCFAQGEAAPLGVAAVPRIAVVDDDKDIHLYLNDLRNLGRFRVVGSYYNAAEALARLPETQPDAVIMDVRLPDMSGIECTTKLKTVLPELRVIILTGFPDGPTFFRSLVAGAQGFLVKPIIVEELLKAIGDVLKGEFALTKQVVPFLVQLVNRVRQVSPGSRLTPREEEVLACIFQGLRDKEIASRLGIGTATVHSHMHQIFEKLGVHSRGEIIAKYLELP
jgi:DNA-binding NarL/FixJ family response regulator